MTAVPPTKDNFWNVPNPCFVHLTRKEPTSFVNSTVKVTNGVGMCIPLCDECVKGMKGLDGDNQSRNIYQKIKPGEIVQVNTIPTPPR